MQNRKSKYFAAAQWLIVSLLLICSTHSLPAQNGLHFFQERGMQDLADNMEAKIAHQARTMLYQMLPATDYEQMESSYLRFNLFLLNENLRICQKITGVKGSLKSDKCSNPTCPNNSNNNNSGKLSTPKPSSLEKEKGNTEATPDAQTKRKNQSIWNRPGNRKVRI